MTAAPHVPVLLDAVLAGIAPIPGASVVDGTFGAGGYTRAVLAGGAALVYAFDRDPTAIAGGATLAGANPDRLMLIHERFSLMDRALAARGVSTVDAIMLDIGVSSMQIDQAARGFSFQADGPLDMRMSNEGPSAADLVNTMDEAAIADILYRYGDEPRSRRVAGHIVAARPITRTGELAGIVRKALGHRPGAPKDPATRTFQALRIAVNDELGELDAGLRAAERLLRPGGRLAVVSFHSLEDRAVKRFLRTRSGGDPQGSRHLPEARIGGSAPTFLAAKAVRPDAAEIAANPRARSATLRIGTRTDAPAWKDDV
ncbi:16S rRNA (cytosine(1402)-N(4))-methyltransferase RsmH [Sphingosinicella soli]|uniref:Ribosomal RNA small subunit methyltransferase H n=1 Tax=Sphingosinicella soli TaxID=333708 RepID=A0A7W7B2G5_9SPHN|nr:16S rRNA (cytosine(1402)-N(4))-methyltransferase RsmH [Sphingosinicella soli]MBB4631817.1 16S rRNA (cytosine1402-N4)-methyltransferase [Sphingosinicella soli]